MRSPRAGTRLRSAIPAASLAALAVLTALVAGCTPSSGARSSAGPSTQPLASVPPSRALASPGCSSATTAGPVLGSVRTATLNTGGAPFGLAVTPDGRWLFVAAGGAGGSVAGGAAAGGSVDVVRLGAGSGKLAVAPMTLVRSIPLPVVPAGVAITPDGRYLLLAAGSGAVVVSVARAEAGTAGAVLGTLAVPAPGPARVPADTSSAIEVAVSPDSRFAFVTLEYADEAVVFNLADAVSRGFGTGGTSTGDYLGAIPLGQAAVGMAVSPDGRWLYATSEVAVPGQHPVGLTGAAGCKGGVQGTERGEPPGTLTVISLPRAETDPAHSVVATVDAGYQPVRVISSADGTQVWVTARASDDLLCFSVARLTSDPARALEAITRVGSEPVGLATAQGVAVIVVADSNRFGASGASSALTVVSAIAALDGRPAVEGEISTGLFPRDMAVSPDGALFVSDFASGQVQELAGASLPVYAPGG